MAAIRTKFEVALERSRFPESDWTVVGITAAYLLTAPSQQLADMPAPPPPNKAVEGAARDPGHQHRRLRGVKCPRCMARFATKASWQRHRATQRYREIAERTRKVPLPEGQGLRRARAPDVLRGPRGLQHARPDGPHSASAAGAPGEDSDNEGRQSPSPAGAPCRPRSSRATTATSASKSSASRARSACR